MAWFAKIEAASTAAFASFVTRERIKAPGDSGKLFVADCILAMQNTVGKC